MKDDFNSQGYKRSRVLYIIEAAVEYFIATVVGTTYLAKLCTVIGMSDGLTGVITSFVSLGFSFQIFALFLTGIKKVRRFCTIMHLINQLAFAFLYMVPVVNIPSTAKIAVFIFLILGGEIIQNVIYSPKMTWLMGFVDDAKRGVFIAKKEIVSLVSGVVVSFSFGRVIDIFEEKGELKIAFLLCGVALFILTAIHTITLIFIEEKPQKEEKQQSVLIMLKASVGNKELLKLIPVFALWQIAVYITAPFYGTYQLNSSETGGLGFSMTLVAVLSFVYAVVRSVFSIPIGRFADKFSFVNSLTLCYGLMIIAYGLNIFYGGAFYIGYGILHSVAMAGINSGAVNLIYDFVPHEQRTGALALKNTIVGFVGFFSTLVAKLLVDFVQESGNKFLWLENVCAQQILSFFSMLITMVLMIYLNTVIRKMRRQKYNSEV